MRYYTDKNMPSNWSYKLANLMEKKTEEQWILTQEGLYKYVNNILHKFKLWLSDEGIVTGIIKPSNMRWTKFDTTYNIPTMYKVIDMDISSYKLHPKSITTLIVEEKDGKISDYYFESEELVDNHSLNEDINSFLSLVN